MINENYSGIVNYAKGLVLAGLVAITSGCASMPAQNYNITPNNSYSLKNKPVTKISNTYSNKPATPINVSSVKQSTKKQSLTQMTADFVDTNPVPLAVLNSTKAKTFSGIKTGIVIDNAGRPTYTISYCAPSFKEFFNGMVMPFTLYRENKSTGKTEILPAYTRPCRSGGALSPEWGLVASGINGVGYLFGAKDSLVYNPFGDNPMLTWGMFLDQAALAVIAGSMGGGSSSGKPAVQQNNDSNDKPADEPKDPVYPPVNPPIVPPTGGDGDGGAVGQ